MPRDWVSFDRYDLRIQMKNLWVRQRSLVLSCKIQDHLKSLFFKNGSIHFAASQAPEDKLHHQLIHLGYLTKSQYRKAGGTFHKEKSIGKNLLDMGLINRQELVGGVQAQIFQIFSSCVNTKKGRFRIEEPPASGQTVNLPLVFPGDFIKALMQNEDKNWVSQRFDSNLDFICEVDSKRYEPLKVNTLPENLAEIYPYMDGRRDFKKMAFETDVDDFMLLKFIHALKFLEYINIRAVDKAENSNSSNPLRASPSAKPADPNPIEPQHGPTLNPTEFEDRLAQIDVSEPLDPALTVAEDAATNVTMAQTAFTSVGPLVGNESETGLQTSSRDTESSTNRRSGESSATRPSIPPTKNSRAAFKDQRTNRLFRPLLGLFLGSLVLAVVYFAAPSLPFRATRPDDTQKKGSLQQDPSIRKRPISGEPRSIQVEPKGTEQSPAPQATSPRASGESSIWQLESSRATPSDKIPSFELTPTAVLEGPAAQPPVAATDPHDPMRLAIQGKYDQAARRWKNIYQQRQQEFTLAIFMLCARKSLDKLLRNLEAGTPVFILPRNYNGTLCYWICWSSYSSYREAVYAIPQLPANLTEDIKGVAAYRIAELLK